MTDSIFLSLQPLPCSPITNSISVSGDKCWGHYPLGKCPVRYYYGYSTPKGSWPWAPHPFTHTTSQCCSLGACYDHGSDRTGLQYPVPPILALCGLYRLALGSCWHKLAFGCSGTLTVSTLTKYDYSHWQGEGHCDIWYCIDAVPAFIIFIMTL